MKLKADTTIICVAARNMGKSVLIKNFLVMQNGLGSLHDVILIHGSAGSFQQYDFLLSKKSPNRIYPELREDVIENCYKVNLARKKKNQALIKFLHIFDDVLDNSSPHNKVVNRLFAVGRHLAQTPLIIAQSLSMLSTTARRNCDVFIFGKPRTFGDIDWAIKNLLQGVNGYEDKKKCVSLLNNLEKYQFIVVDYTGGDTKCGLIKSDYIYF